MSLIRGLTIAFTVFVSAPSESVRVGDFSRDASAELPADWEVLRFDGKPPTRYELIADGERTVVRATSHASASGLVRRVGVAATRLPVIEWSWRIDGLISGADLARRSGDDCAARVYVTFACDRAALSLFERLSLAVYDKWTGEETPCSALAYVWAGHEREGTTTPNAYTERTQVIVVQSGGDDVGQWVSERRNLVDDYRAAFGVSPTELIGVGIMTDTDDTGKSTVAYYGDIVLAQQ